jgi:Ala-tRNA(Pro) deacylase
MIAEGLLEDLVAEHIDCALVPHRRTEHARDEAAALGIPPDEVGKTLVVKGAEGYARIVLAASDRLDLLKLRELLDDRSLRLATEDELGVAYAEFELGAVPPVGGPAGDRVVVDRRIADLEKVTVEAGTHDQSLRLPTADLVTLTKAVVADVRLDG